MRAFVQERADEFEQICNWVSDQDGQWWPFLFLRPEPEQRMSTGRVAALSVLLGFFFGMIASIAAALSGHGVTWQLSIVTFPLWTSAGFFAFYRLTFAYSWNRRAARLVARC